MLRWQLRQGQRDGETPLVGSSAFLLGPWGEGPLGRQPGEGGAVRAPPCRTVRCASQRAFEVTAVLEHPAGQLPLSWAGPVIPRDS